MMRGPPSHPAAWVSAQTPPPRGTGDPSGACAPGEPSPGTHQSLPALAPILTKANPERRAGWEPGMLQQVPVGPHTTLGQVPEELGPTPSNKEVRSLPGHVPLFCCSLNKHIPYSRHWVRQSWDLTPRRCRPKQSLSGALRGAKG